MSSLKVEIAEIKELIPHNNADKLEIAIIHGWRCVVQRYKYKVGSKVIYIPIDAVLPKDIEEKIFGKDSKLKLHKGRIRTIKLRGEISQGLVCDPEIFNLEDKPVGTDVSKLLKIKKHEPAYKPNNQNTDKLSRRRENSNFNKYTSIENFKNHNDIFINGEKVFITEKIHGTNFRAGWIKRDCEKWYMKLAKKFKLLSEYEFIFGTHNLQLNERLLEDEQFEKNVYVEAVNKYKLKEIIPKNTIIYGEIYGDRIQRGYTYGCEKDERKLIIFDVVIDGKYINFIDTIKFCKKYEFKVVPVIYNGPYNDVKAMSLSHGRSILCEKQEIREGVVIKPHEETYCKIGRKILKLINDDYLLNKNNTDFH